MVGLYLSVWVRSEMLPHVRGVQTSSVGTGVMGYFGNKGALHPCIPEQPSPCKQSEL